MKFKVIEEKISYIELNDGYCKTDAVHVFVNNPEEVKYIHSSRRLVKIEKIDKFERPVCKVTIPDNQNVHGWTNVGKKISMTLRKEGFDQPADDFISEFDDDINFMLYSDSDGYTGYTRERLEKVAEPYVKLEIIESSTKGKNRG